MKKHISTRDITKIAIMAALVFVATFLIKIPSLNGYTHIGDSMIFISVLILGKKKGALASGVGAAICDLLSGYMQYILPTFFIKFIMAFIMGAILEKLANKVKFAWVIGAVLGGIFQVFGYAFVETIMYGFAGALASVPSNIVQSAVGVVVAITIVTVLEKSNVFKKLKNV